MSDGKKLAFSIIKHLQSCIDAKTVGEEQSESLTVAIQCISDAFTINVDSDATDLDVDASLKSVFDVLLRTQNKNKTTPITGKDKISSKQEAESLKNQGNAQLVAKQYKDAISLYSQAIDLDSENPVYYSNRAAAYSQSGDHQLAVNDCEAAIGIDSQYSKAYSRLGLAYYSLGKYQEAIDAYKKVLELDPGNETAKKSLSSAEGKVAALSSSPTSSANNPLAGLAGLGGAGGLSSLLSNPAMMEMAQKMMQNPQMAAMAQSMMGGSADGSNPLAGLMNNPELMNM